MEPIRIRILLEGQLQGLNFRYHAHQQAKKLGLVGFIRTLSDGRIEIDVQGPEEDVMKMLAWCQASPQSEHIKTILYRHDQPTERYFEFVVK
jgi:acylphosphatase